MHVVTYNDGSFDNNAKLTRLAQYNYDIAFYTLGASDPNPDTSWRYIQSRISERFSPVTIRDLDAALVEPNQGRRAQMYQEIERRNARDPMILPLRLIGATYFVRPPLTIPDEAGLEWGLPFSRLEIKP